MTSAGLWRPPSRIAKADLTSAGLWRPPARTSHHRSVHQPQGGHDIRGVVASALAHPQGGPHIRGVVASALGQL